MSYPKNCLKQGCQKVQRIPYFSNTDKTYQGSPMGTAANNNSLQLTRAAPGVAINRFRSSKSIFTPDSSYYLETSFNAIMFDVVPKKDITLQNIELELTRSMEISVYFATGSYTDIGNLWGDPIITQNLSLYSEMNSKLADRALFDSFKEVSLIANQMYSFRIERTVRNNEAIYIAFPSTSGIHYENNDITLYTGQFTDFGGYTYPNNAGLSGGLIYSESASTPTCKDSTRPFLVNKRDRKCDWVAKTETAKRCAIAGGDVATHCPKTCGACGNCVDAKKRFYLKKNGNLKSCEWVANLHTSERCKMIGDAYTCRNTCGNC